MFHVLDFSINADSSLIVFCKIYKYHSNEINNQTSVSFCDWLGKVVPCSSVTSSLVKSRTSSVCVDWSKAEGNPVISSVLSMEASVCSGIEVSKMKSQIKFKIAIVEE